MIKPNTNELKAAEPILEQQSLEADSKSSDQDHHDEAFESTSGMQVRLGQPDPTLVLNTELVSRQQKRKSIPK